MGDGILYLGHSGGIPSRDTQGTCRHHRGHHKGRNGPRHIANNTHRASRHPHKPQKGRDTPNHTGSSTAALARQKGTEARHQGEPVRVEGEAR